MISGEVLKETHRNLSKRILGKNYERISEETPIEILIEFMSKKIAGKVYVRNLGIFYDRVFFLESFPKETMN